VRHYLKKGWSPDQIAGRFKLEGSFNVSYQTIYRYLYEDRAQGGTLYRHLRRKGRRYRHKRTSGGPIRNRRYIEERPA
jgi:IS30 family transposase